MVERSYTLGETWMTSGGTNLVPIQYPGEPAELTEVVGCRIAPRWWWKMISYTPQISATEPFRRCDSLVNCGNCVRRGSDGAPGNLPLCEAEYDISAARGSDVDGRRNDRVGSALSGEHGNWAVASPMSPLKPYPEPTSNGRQFEGISP